MHQTLQKNFVLEKETTQQTMVYKGRIMIVDGIVDLVDILGVIGDISNSRFKIYDFCDNKYHLFSDYFEDGSTPFSVPARLVQADIVLIKYLIDTSETVSLNSSAMSSSDASSIKKERSKERTIAQVIQIVKQWRQMHFSPGNGTKLNLQQAAEVVGISKKSLDDYYYQLRLGEKHEFDFSENMNEKVGVLRAFIKNIKSKSKSKSQSSKISDKHPKKLRIIDEIGDNQSDSIENDKRKTKSSKVKTEIVPNQFDSEKKDQIYDPPLFNHDAIHYLAFEPMDEEHADDKNSIKSIEDQFYQDFQFLGDEQADPFLNFKCDFKKKDYDDNQMDDQFLF